MVDSLLPKTEQSTAHDFAARVLKDAHEPIDRIASHLLRTSPAASAERVDLRLERIPALDAP